MRIYPDTPNERGRAVARDALTLLALLVLAWLALKVHDAVDELAVLGTGVADTGTAVVNRAEITTTGKTTNLEFIGSRKLTTSSPKCPETLQSGLFSGGQKAP